MIVDLEPSGRPRPSVARAALMPLVVAVLATGFGAILLRPGPDPEEGAARRARVAAAFPTLAPSATPSPVVRATPAARSVIAGAHRARPLPPPLQIPPEVGTLVPGSDPPDGSSTAAQRSGSAGRELAYRLRDGRVVTLMQLPLGSPVRLPAAYGIDESVVRGQIAVVVTSRLRGFTAALTWTEAGASYELSSGSLTVRELVMIADQLRSALGGAIGALSPSPPTGAPRSGARAPFAPRRSARASR